MFTYPKKTLWAAAQLHRFCTDGVGVGAKILSRSGEGSKESGVTPPSRIYLCTAFH